MSCKQADNWRTRRSPVWTTLFRFLNVFQVWPTADRRGRQHLINESRFRINTNDPVVKLPREHFVSMERFWTDTRLPSLVPGCQVPALWVGDARHQLSELLYYYYNHLNRQYFNRISTICPEHWNLPGPFIKSISPKVFVHLLLQLFLKLLS